MFRIITAAAAAVVVLAAGAPALAQSSVQVGVLQCSGGQNVSYIVGSTSSLNCTFSPKSGKSEAYAATLRHVGLDVGFTSNSVMTWAVFAPSSKVGKGGLVGNYGGVSAGAAVGVGGGANVLVGGSSKTITLQPLSIQGQTGVNVAAAVSNLELAAPPTKKVAKASKSSTKKKK